MPIPEQEKAVLRRMLELIAERGSRFYETGVQTTVLSRGPSGWQNLLTKLDFVRKGKSRPDELSYEYKEAAIVRRLLAHPEAATVLEKLSTRTCSNPGTLTAQSAFSPDSA
jgi:hypothetical protein